MHTPAYVLVHLLPHRTCRSRWNLSCSSSVGCNKLGVNKVILKSFNCSQSAVNVQSAYSQSAVSRLDPGSSSCQETQFLFGPEKSSRAQLLVHYGKSVWCRDVWTDRCPDLSSAAELSTGWEEKRAVWLIQWMGNLLLDRLGISKVTRWNPGTDRPLPGRSMIFFIFLAPQTSRPGRVC